MINYNETGSSNTLYLTYDELDNNCSDSYQWYNITPGQTVIGTSFTGITTDFANYLDNGMEVYLDANPINGDLYQVAYVVSPAVSITGSIVTICNLGDKTGSSQLNIGDRNDQGYGISLNDQSALYGPNTGNSQISLSNESRTALLLSTQNSDYSIYNQYDIVGNTTNLRFREGTENYFRTWLQINKSATSTPNPVRFLRNTEITGSLTVTQGITGSLRGTSSFATTASFALNAGGSDRNGLITTGSAFSSQKIQGTLQISGSASQPLEILAGANTARIDIFNAGPAFYRNSSTYNTVIGNAAGVQNGFTGSNNLLFTGFFMGFTSGSFNTVISGNGGANFRSGSNNTILGNIGSLEYGNYNTYIGSGGPTSIESNTLRISAGGSDILVKSGSNALQIGSNTQITGSLNVSGNINNLKIWTGSLNSDSIGIGSSTLNSQTGSSLNNIAIGNGALGNNVTGANVVAIGNGALQNSVAGFNLALGASALSSNTTGQYNIAIGQSSYQANTIGEKNTAIGWNSGVNNITGSTNTIIGAQALQQNFNGSGNVAIGNNAGYYSTGSNQFFVGNDNYGGIDNEKNKSLLYGVFDNTLTNQTLQINAKTTVQGSIQSTAGFGQVELLTNQTLPSSVDTVITFNNNEFDPSGWYNTEYFYYQPTIAGIYQISYSVNFEPATAGTGQVNVQITKDNGMDINQLAINQHELNLLSNTSLTGTVFAQLDGNLDKLYLTAYSSVGQDVNGGNGTYLNIKLL